MSCESCPSPSVYDLLDFSGPMESVRHCCRACAIALAAQTPFLGICVTSASLEPLATST